MKRIQNPNRNGRWGNAEEVTFEGSQEKLEADGGLLKERLKIAGTAALITILEGPDNSNFRREVSDSLVALRNKWLTEGVEDKRKESLEDLIVYPTHEPVARVGGKHMGNFPDTDA